MNTSEKTFFITMLLNIAELYNKPLSQSMLEIYWNILKKYSLQKIKHSIHLHLLDIEQGKFMPKPPDLLKFLEKSPEEKASLAWSQVSAAMGLIGAYESVVFEDAIIHSVIIDMGGWIKLCHLQDAQLPFEEKDFKRRYVSYLIHPPSNVPKQLTGLLNHEKAVRIGLEESDNNLALTFKQENTNHD